MSDWHTRKQGHNIGAMVARNKKSRDKAEAKTNEERVLAGYMAFSTASTKPVTLPKVKWLARSDEFDSEWERKYGRESRGNLQHRPNRSRKATAARAA